MAAGTEAPSRRLPREFGDRRIGGDARRGRKVMLRRGRPGSRRRRHLRRQLVQPRRQVGGRRG